MIVKMAVATDNFIDAIGGTNVELTGSTFLDCLKEIFNFEDIDIKDFDGNTCKMIASNNPTNSIFIYENNQGTFLYQITSATPYIHKNNMIWNCNTYKMEDISKINEVLSSDMVQAVIYKNIAPSFDFYSETKNNKVNVPNYNVEVKNNFKTQSVYKLNLINDTICCLKLKFLVNPTTIADLTTEELDGSFNFYFPFYCGVKTHTTSEDYFPLVEPTYKIINKNNTSQVLKLQDIISKYSENLKTIEIIPFNPLNSLGGNVAYSNVSNESITLDCTSGARWTDAGVFLPYGHTIKRTLQTQFNSDMKVFQKAICFGGGARGILKTPLVALDLDFDSFRLSQSQQGTDSPDFDFYLKSEGWKIDGAVKVDVPPHYLNFYTDNAGQVFIQNMTTNAQELRNLTRETNYKQEDLERNFVANSIKKSVGIASSIVSGDFSGFVSNSLDFGSSVLENELQKQQIQREYNRSLIEYNDKIDTQNLLAKMTGKQISGNSIVSDLTTNFDKDDYCLIVELNCAIKGFWNGAQTNIYRFFEVQRDYDYSVQMLKRENSTIEYDRFNVYLNNTKEGLVDPYKYRYIYEFMGTIFGCGLYSTSGENITYIDKIGLNYNVTFKIKKIFSQSLQRGDSADLKETQILNFPIRHKTIVGTF